MKLGSHVSMSGKDMLLGSAKEAVSYGADTFMFYTGAPPEHAPQGYQRTEYRPCLGIYERTRN